MRNKNILLVLVMFCAVLLSGCASNYKTYADSMAADLQAIAPVYSGYIHRDKRLSAADIKARLSILVEMQKKTTLAQKDAD